VIELSRLQARRGVLQTTIDDDRRQRPLLVWLSTPCVGGPVITYSVSGVGEPA